MKKYNDALDEAFEARFVAIIEAAENAHAEMEKAAPENYNAVKEAAKKKYNLIVEKAFEDYEIELARIKIMFDVKITESLDYLISIGVTPEEYEDYFKEASLQDDRMENL